MVTIANIPDWVWLLLGFVISLLFDQIPERAKLKMPSRTMGYIFLLFNLLLLIWNTAFILRISAIVAESETGGVGMSTTDIQTLLWWSQLFQILAFVTFGFIVGIIIVAGVRGIISKRKKNGTEVEFYFSTKKLESTAEEIEGYKRAMSALDDFFKRLSGRGEKESKPEIKATKK